MNWIDEYVRPRFKSALAKREGPENLWVKCRACGQMIFHRDLEANQHVCTNCGHHMRIRPRPRFEALFDPDTFEPIAVKSVVADPLKFKDEKKYVDRIKEARAKTGEDDAVLVGHGRILGQQAVAAAQDFTFMGGSLGMAAGEAIVTGARAAVERNAPFLMFSASGGARMQEGILSLMQMPRTTVGVQMLRDAGLPYIVILTDPTTGGVSASFAMLGDIHISEPGALIGFSGRRVIEQTIREKLPEGFQTAEYLLEHGIIDMIVHRHKMRETLGRIISLLMAPDRARPDTARAGPQPISDAALGETGDEDDEPVEILPPPRPDPAP